MQLKEIGLVAEGARTPSKVAILPLSEAAVPRVLETAAALRSAGVSALAQLDVGQPSKQLRYADRLGVAWAIVVGEDEVANKKLILKDMATGAQDTMAITKVVKKLTADK